MAVFLGIDDEGFSLGKFIAPVNRKYVRNNLYLKRILYMNIHSLSDILQLPMNTTVKYLSSGSYLSKGFSNWEELLILLFSSA